MHHAGKSRYRLFQCILLLCCSLLWALLIPRIAVANDNCKTSNGVTTCSGDQSAGVQNGHNNLDTNASDVKVQDLSQDIGPNLNSDRAAGLTFTYDSGDSLPLLTLQYLEDTYKIVVDGTSGGGSCGNSPYGTWGILFCSKSKNGGSGEDESTESGQEGHHGDNGRAFNLTLGSGANIVASKNSLGAIYVSSIGGNGGKGGNSDCCSGGHGGHSGDGGAISIVGAGNLTANLNGNYHNAVEVNASGGDGGNGGNAGVDGHGGDGEAGGQAGGTGTLIDSQGSWNISAGGLGTAGVLVANTGGHGGHGGAGFGDGEDGGDGGAGGAGGGQIKINTRHSGSWVIDTSGAQAPGMSLQAIGGNAGNGGTGDTARGGHGGQGGQGGDIVFGNITGSVATQGDNSPGLVLLSKAGQGGEGGTSAASLDKGGDGGSGGGGGTLTLKGDWAITTSGSQSFGIAGYSLGADGGKGGDGTFSTGGAGGSTGPSGPVTIDISGSITTKGGGAQALIAQSVAGHAGSGGSSVGLVSFAASGGSAGAGGTVDLTNNASITTLGDQSTGITAQSIGGGGGNGGDAFGAFYSKGGSGSLGGAGGAVSVTNDGALTLSGNDAHAIFAQSIGGAGGSGGNAGGIVSLGGGGEGGSDGGTVTVSNSATIITGQETGSTPPSGPDQVCGSGCSNGIFAQSIGGGGGHGGTVGGAFSVGGSGGGGGDGAKVTVTTTGDITTNMSQSQAILAQSVGGGGGNGGGSGALDAVFSIAIGGAGGNGGSGGEVVVAPKDGASITTAGDDSNAVHAQSVGGGGGNAGFAVSAAAGADVPAIAVAIGGSGGSGGSGGAASIDTVDPNYNGATPTQVTTSGERSSGLVAQSIGGGGGNGGTTVAFAGSDEFAGSFAIGGSGGSGGSAGSATVTSDAVVSTSGDNAPAIISQSIGGGGGNGGLTVSGTLNIGGDGATVAIGGGGGNAGSGGQVSVTSSASVSAGGDQSAGIVAQSIGGGGGNGGMTIAGTLSSSDNQTLGVAIGSGAGSGGSADAVTVKVLSGGDVTVSGNRSAGVFAQSVGGGGGNGGMTLNGNFAASTDNDEYSVTLGSNGGSGGDGGSVQVTSAAPIITGNAQELAYTQAHGIVAQSVGGGGGSGAVTGFLQLGFSENAVSHSLDVEMSGSGNGGKGGSASISNSAAVTTVNRNSHALFAQSVGGGGGDADAAMWSLIDLTTNDPTPSFSTDYVGGGSLGSGNTGGAVTVDNSAQLTTSGPWSHGIFAQSVGGGGGSSAPLGNPFIPCSSCSSTESVIWNASVALGGQTGSGGNGGDVTVTNSGGVQTSGPGSYGIFAQSIGAGGGSAGAASALSQGGQFIGASEFTVLDAALGAAGNSSKPVSGNGGTVSVTHSAGEISTAGVGATAIYAQSVGAGGGHGGVGAIGGGGSVDVGGNGDAAGDGGDVTVDVNGGSIMAGTRSGDAGIVSGAYGIFAQSVGGGGGHGGNVLFGSTDNFTSLAGLTSSKGSDSSGDGGTVTVNLAVPLSTAGDSSVGILAQSVGGGGGIKGETIKNPTGAKAGSNGGSGKPGAVAVTVTGSVTTTGSNAYGIWAQSAGGSDSGTTTDTMVQVDLSGSGSVQASGADSIGIFAQSVGDGRGPIVIDLESANTSVSGSTAIYVKDAPSSSISNNGTIAPSDPDTGTAIQAENTMATVTNNGSIEGNICQGTSCKPPASPSATTSAATERITLINQPSGRITSRDRLEVDQFINRGTLDIGGPDSIRTTIHRGNLAHLQTGKLLLDLDASQNRADKLVVEGTADLAGKVAVKIIDAGHQKARESVTFLTAQDGISERSPMSFSVKPSVVANYALEFRDADQIGLSYQIDFAGPQILATANDNQRSVIQHIQSIFQQGALDTTLTALTSISDLASYTTAMDSLGAEVFADNQLTTLYSGMLFNDSLLSCAMRSGDYRFVREGQCGWMSLQGRRSERDDTSDNIGFDETTWQLAAGGQMDVGRGWAVGGALSYESRDLDLDSDFGDSNGWQLQGGVVAKKRINATTLSGSLSLGYADFDTHRNVFGGMQAKGDQNVWLASAQLRAAHTFERGDWYIKPITDLGLLYLSMDDLNEGRAGGESLAVHDQSDTYVYLQPAVELGGEHAFANGTLLRPKLVVGLTRFLTSTSPSVEAAFQTAPGGIGTFKSESKLDRTYFDVAVGMDILTTKSWVVSANAVGQFSENTSSFGGNLTLSIPF